LLLNIDACRFVACALVSGLTAACAGVPPLDDAEVTELALASPADLSRYRAAKDYYYRAILTKGLPPITIVQPDWPTLHVTFQSQRQLFNPLEAGPRLAVIYLCGERDQEWGVYGFRSAKILWRDRFVDQEASKQIAAQLKTEPKLQEYEVFFSYSYWDSLEAREEGDPITLLPLPDDLCLSLHKLNYPFAPSTGEPLRIGKEAVNEAVGDLPRPLLVPVP